jgi:cytochrome c-type biogenesis protein CcmH/NrfG
MTQSSKSARENWTSMQAYSLAVVCLLIGMASGWFIRGSKPPVSAAAVETGTPAPSGTTAGQPSPEQLKHMADVQAQPVLAKLKDDPNNPELLGHLGNIYYDTQQYQDAIDYYERVLKVQPGNAGVRTDMATAYWYLGNPDTAIEQFNQALRDEPNKANTLFNLGVVQWQGKMDIKSAVATWQKLLATNPDYESKDKVLQLIAEAEKHSGVKPGTRAKSLPN